jgi:hypothetical protein
MKTIKNAEELAEKLLAEADATGIADWDTIAVMHNDDGTYAEGDNGDGADGLTRAAVKQVLIDDIMLRADYRSIQ